MLEVTVKIDLLDLKRFGEAVKADLRTAGTGPIRDALHQWAFRYRSAMQERFVVYSRGGGDWPPLSPKTIAARDRRPVTRLNRSLAAGDITQAQYDKRIKTARRKMRKAAQGHVGGAGVAILRDTGTLFAALTPQFSAKPGALQEDIPFGVKVGFGGPAKYPKGKASIADIAAFHQAGGPHLPQRKILVDPEERIKQQMAADMTRALETLLKQCLKQ